MFEEAQRHLAAKGLKVSTSTVVDAGRRRHGPADFTNRRYRHRAVVDAIECAKEPHQIEGVRQELTLAKAKFEHPIRIIKRVFGFAKVRYHGLKKNADRFIVTCAPCALANLFKARRLLLH